MQERADPPPLLPLCLSHDMGVIQGLLAGAISVVVILSHPLTNRITSSPLGNPTFALPRAHLCHQRDELFAARPLFAPNRCAFRDFSFFPEFASDGGALPAVPQCPVRKTRLRDPLSLSSVPFEPFQSSYSLTHDYEFVERFQPA